MTVPVDDTLQLIEAGLDIVELDAAVRSIDNLIRIAQAIVARGRAPMILNAGSITPKNLLRLHEELGGKVTFSGV